MNTLRCVFSFYQVHIGAGTGGAAPNQIIWGASSTSCYPNFFCNLQLKVTLQTVRLLLTQKNSGKFPSFWGFAPDPIVH